MKLTLILFLAVFTLIEADKPKVDIGTIRLPKEWEAAWIDFIEPIIKFKNEPLLVCRLDFIEPCVTRKRHK